MENNLKSRDGLWTFGKKEYKRFMNIKIKRKTSILSFLYGILLTAIPILPIAWFLFELVEIFWFQPSTVYIFLTIAWVLFMFANGLSNYLTIRILKVKEKDMSDLQSINDKAVFFYQSLNIGFGIFILAILVFFLVEAMQ
ncbi:MAG: hypothetical protein MRZ09_00760 [Coprobacillus sp.]|nr:hypothetical protein [Coprobacillus sp.]OLA09755.1 MAG: hypothetical protein BHW12_03640 [Coprobacillus sp. 28_7]CCY07636.1 unknown [Coprobacillus sp. CAG:698]